MMFMHSCQVLVIKMLEKWAWQCVGVEIAKCQYIFREAILDAFSE